MDSSIHTNKYRTAQLNDRAAGRQPRVDSFTHYEALQLTTRSASRAHMNLYHVQYTAAISTSPTTMSLPSPSPTRPASRLSAISETISKRPLAVVFAIPIGPGQKSAFAGLVIGPGFSLTLFLSRGCGPAPDRHERADRAKHSHNETVAVEPIMAAQWSGLGQQKSRFCTQELNCPETKPRRDFQPLSMGVWVVYAPANGCPQVVAETSRVPCEPIF
jgi:hypothetical protein